LKEWGTAFPTTGGPRRTARKKKRRLAVEVPGVLEGVRADRGDPSCLRWVAVVGGKNLGPLKIGGVIRREIRQAKTHRGKMNGNT